MLAFVAALTILLLFSGSAVAQISAPDCFTPSWGWTFNSMGQNPCTVAAFLLSTCNMGTYYIYPLPPGHSYSGPSGIEDSGNLCKCNTVTYSLLSACDACQSQLWITWSKYSVNCTQTLAPGGFPNLIPAVTRVPEWAFLDITLENTWNVNNSMATGDGPEVGPDGVVIGTSSYSITATATGGGTVDASLDPTRSISTYISSLTILPPPRTATATATPTGGSNAGAIAGGVVGGIAAISIVAAALFFFLRRRQRPQAPQAPASVVDGPSQPRMDEYRRPLSDNTSFVPPSVPETHSTSMRLYDPNEPTTFTGCQPPSLETDGPPPYENVNILASMQTSQPPGHHGFPSV